MIQVCETGINLAKIELTNAPVEQYFARIEAKLEAQLLIIDKAVPS